MMQLILGIVSTLFQMLTLIGGASIIVLLWFMYHTKPTDESFKKFLKHELNKSTESRILTFFANKLFDKEIKDYIFFKIAQIDNIYDGSRGNNTIIFIGIFQTWFRLI